MAVKNLFPIGFSEILISIHHVLDSVFNTGMQVGMSNECTSEY